LAYQKITFTRKRKIRRKGPRIPPPKGDRRSTLIGQVGGVTTWTEYFHPLKIAGKEWGGHEEERKREKRFLWIKY